MDPLYRKLNRSRESLERDRRNRVGHLRETKDYNLFEEDSLRPNTVRKQAFRGIFTETLLNQVFMSQENMDLIQDMIRLGVYKRSNKEFIIGKQSEIELQIIMRSIFLQYAKNRPNDIKGQIKELNNLVIQDSVPDVLSQIVAYKHYLHDASNTYQPNALPENMSSAGRKILPSVTRTFFS